MKKFNYFIGIDIGKFSFVTSLYGSKKTREYKNDSSGIELFLKEYAVFMREGLCILETTGGYELEVLLQLSHKQISVHRANPSKVKNFILSFGHKAKTDALDAKALALYGYKRHEQLKLYVPPSNQELELKMLVSRREDLKQILVSEKNRKECPNNKLVKNSIKKVLECLNEQIKEITEYIENKISEDESLREKSKILQTVPGIGKIVANQLVILLPELGKISRRSMASLIGVAPMSRDSGTRKGYRRTGYGRNGIKPMLYLSAMSASRSKSNLGDYYEGLIKRGKKKMVALCALMRKIIVIANARIRDYLLEKKCVNHS